MKDHINIIKKKASEFFTREYNQSIEPADITVNPTKREFEGDFTVVLFPFLKALKLRPFELGSALGDFLVENTDFVISHNTVHGFLNLSYSNKFFTEISHYVYGNTQFGKKEPNNQKVMVEFSSPNTNKPLHLGHIRNILLGWSISKILETSGYDVIRTQIVNDRGIAVCKSMLAWSKFGNGITPSSSGIKGDHLVGDFYVLFDQKFSVEYKEWQQSLEAKNIYSKEKRSDEELEIFFKRYKNDYFNKHSQLGKEARELLMKWEEGDAATKSLWVKMNGWVYDGFDLTYKKLKVYFDKLYYESDTYLLGRSTVEYGLKKGIFYKESDGSVWIDLTDAGHDKKIVLRADGTSVYMTQDIGTAMVRYKDFGIDKMIYVVADEQDYHFQVLFEILKRLGEPYADHLHHLSYGMVDLPHGRMKSREGNVVDADDLIDEIVSAAKNAALERENLPGETEEEQQEVFRKIGIAALKYHIIKVAPQKRMVFNPEESLDMQGQTGPYIQNAYVRIQSILRKTGEIDKGAFDDYELQDEEKALVKLTMEFPSVIEHAAQQYDPSGLANYLYGMAKSFHKFYHEFRILGAESIEAKNFRLILIKNIAKILRNGMELLGIEMPERM